MTLVIYIDFIPTLRVENIEWGCLHSMARPLPTSTLRRCKYVLIDQGITAARRGASEGELWWWYTHAVSTAKAVNPQADVKAVAPDSFGSMEKTIELWEKWAPRLERLGATPVLVLQEPRRVDAWIRTKAYRETQAVAIPSRFMDSHTKCVESPLVCAGIISTIARIAKGDGKWIHLLGATSKRLLKALRPLLGRDVNSIDSLGYRLASSKDVRVRLEPGGPGGYMVMPGMEEDYLEAWMRGVFI